MEKKKLNQKIKTKSKKSGFLRSFCMCVYESDEEEEYINPRARPYVSVKPSKLMAAKREISVTYATTSSYYLMPPVLPKLENISPNNALLSQAYSEKIENTASQKDRSSTPTIDEESNEAEIKEQKDQLVKSILNKYLQLRREEMLNKNPETVNRNPDNLKSPQTPRADFLNVECSSSDSSETIILENTTNNQHLKSPRPKVDFPTKSKSAPTNSTAHDSLADICFKMSRYKQQENQSDSYVTCCSEEITKDSSTTKKMELIFNPSSENTSCLEDNSSFSLQYKISCERTPVATGILRSDSLLLQSEDERNSDMVNLHNRRRISPQELYLNPSPYVNREIDGLNGSSSSLKWKLIISHHGRGDFP